MPECSCHTATMEAVLKSLFVSCTLNRKQHPGNPHNPPHLALTLFLLHCCRWLSRRSGSGSGRRRSGRLRPPGGSRRQGTPPPAAATRPRTPTLSPTSAPCCRWGQHRPAVRSLPLDQCQQTHPATCTVPAMAHPCHILRKACFAMLSSRCQPRPHTCRCSRWTFGIKFLYRRWCGAQSRGGASGGPACRRTRR